MSIPTHEATTPLVCVLDRDGASLASYQRVVEGQGMRLLFFETVAELRSQTPLDRLSALVLDIEGDRGDGLQLQREMLDRGLATPIIVTASDRNSDKVVQSLRLGAAAVLPRPWAPNALSTSLDFAHAQQSEQASLDRSHLHLKQILESLTPRQKRVLDLAATGVPNKLIATQIEVSQRTVESERAKLLDAFGSDSYSAAMIRLGEYRALERVARIRRRDALHRLGNRSPTIVAAPIEAGRTAQPIER